MKLLFDLFPVILFFAAYKAFDLYVATGVAIAASIAQIVYLKVRGKPVETMQWASLVIIVIFGGMTLLLHDETFIKWKPSILYFCFFAALIGGRMFMQKNFIKSLMGAQLKLPEPVWDKLNMAWAVFFLSMAVLNLVVAYQFSTDTWVNFKLFGTMGLTLAFVIAQGLYLGRYIQDEA
jgi:intracellular septation protein